MAYVIGPRWEAAVYIPNYFMFLYYYIKFGSRVTFDIYDLVNLFSRMVVVCQLAENNINFVYCIMID